GGPNDPPVDSDMLFGHGNILFLQNDWYNAHTVQGFWDIVTDDPDGGNLIFDFTSPVEPHGVLMIDLDPPPNQGAVVTLTDDGSRTRTYTVEAGWTGPFGNPGPWRLDLTTLAPQPGNGTPRFATATETPGFLPNHVVKMVVHMTGFGAVDDLEF